MVRSGGDKPLKGQDMNASAALKWVFSLVTSTESDKDRVVRGKLPDDEKELRDKFLCRPDDPHEKPTHFQERMQSGGS